MGDIQRFEFYACEDSIDGAYIEEAPYVGGEYVKYDHHKQIVDELRNQIILLDADRLYLEDEVSELKAQLQDVSAMYDYAVKMLKIAHD